MGLIQSAFLYFKRRYIQTILITSLLGLIYSESTETKADLVICGIYRVETDFEILDANTEGTSVYIHSPYNTIYMDYYAAQELLGIDITASETGAELA